MYRCPYASDVCLPVNAFVDSGSAGNFISGALCHQLKLKTFHSPKVYQIHAVTGCPLRQVRHMVGPLKFRIGVLHEKLIYLLVLEDSTSDVILGRPWLEQHDPNISWKTGDILKWGTNCFNGCFPNMPTPSKDYSPVTSQDSSPVSSRDSSPVPSQDSSPVPSQDSSSVSSRDASPVPSRDSSPAPSRDSSPVSSRKSSSVSKKNSRQNQSQVSKKRYRQKSKSKKVQICVTSIESPV
ncbi:MAG: retropepsin-like aspartic protease [Aeromonas veronii]